MKAKQKIKVLEEIAMAEEEEKKYDLGDGFHVFIQDIDDRKMFWTDKEGNKQKVSETEVNNYGKYSNIIRVIYASNEVDEQNENEEVR